MSNHELAKEYFLSGCAFLAAGDFFQAEIKFMRSLELIPDRASTLTNLSVAQLKLKKYSEAKAAAKKAIVVESDNSEAYLNLGVIEGELKSYEAAGKFFDKALSLKPDYHEAWLSKANLLLELKRYEEAIVNYEKVIDLKSDNAEAWANKGITLNELKRYEEAISHYDKALSLNRNIDWVSGNLLHAKMKMCSWSGFAESLNNIQKKVMLNEKVVQPFSLLALNDVPLLHKKASEIFAENKYPYNPVLGLMPRLKEGRKIRVGYFSADFGNHPVSILTAELFELHDKSRFDIVAFSFGEDDKSPMRLRLGRAFSQFFDVSQMSDLEITKLSRELSINIAVDLGGYTGGGRPGVFAHRAAPIQLSYIGYLGTTGAQYFDYLLADRVIVPNGSESYYSEKITYLPSYQANDRKRIISERNFTRAELGLPEDAFVFCCFNNNYKILPTTFYGWIHILKSVKNSVLFLYAENEWVKENLKREAKVRGVDCKRLIFGDRIAADENLYRYQICDLFLDTFPYNAGATASDALWAGLPILTLSGKSFASRMAASLLNSVGLSELITNTQDEYEALAIELALNPIKFADIKLKLAKNRLVTPLFDTPLFVKNLETAYLKMYEQYQADLDLQPIFID